MGGAAAGNESFVSKTPQRVLVTGATGFLGSWVTRKLARAGHSVRVLVRRPERLHDVEGLKLDVVVGDVLQPHMLREAARDIDVIVNCAGLVSWRPRDRPELHRANVQGTINVLDVARDRHLRLVHTSSISTLGGTQRPQLFDERTPSVPLPFDCPYTESKRTSEQLVASYGNAVILSPGIILGPGDKYGSSTQLVLSYLRGQLHNHMRGGGTYCDVRDAADAYVAALESWKGDENYILAGTNLSHEEFREKLQRVTGLQRTYPLSLQVAEWAASWSEAASVFGPHPLEDLSLPVVRWGALYTYTSSQKAERVLGYQRRDFLETLRDTIAYLLRQRAAYPTTSKLRRLVEIRDRETC